MIQTNQFPKYAAKKALQTSLNQRNSGQKKSINWAVDLERMIQTYF